MLYFYPYKAGSRSAVALARHLGGRIIRLKNSKFKPSKDKIVINWGVSNKLPDEMFKCQIINKPSVVGMASNKLRFFLSLGEHENIPQWTTDRQQAEEWAETRGGVCCRTLLQSHSAKGLVLAKTKSEVVDAKLYVRYIKKTHEYRVHVVRGQVIDVQRKARKLDVPNDQVDWHIRNLDNGFIYERGSISELSTVMLERVKEVACWVINKVDLDFGAVDIIYNKRKDMFYVLEVNTAPGITGTTLQLYANAFSDLENELRES